MVFESFGMFEPLVTHRLGHAQIFLQSTVSPMHLGDESPFLHNTTSASLTVQVGNGAAALHRFFERLRRGISMTNSNCKAMVNSGL